MQTTHPLKTLILYTTQAEIDAIKKVTQKFPDVFNVLEISRAVFDALVVLNSHSFDLTFFDETAFPIDLIETVGKKRFGLIVFKNKKTLSWKLNLATKSGGYFYLEPPFDGRQTDLIKNLRAEVIKRNFVHQHTLHPVTNKLPFQVGAKTYYLSPQQIIFIEVRGKLSKVYYEEADEVKTIPQSNGLGVFERHFDQNMFFRIHRSRMINIAFIKRVIDSSRIVVLTKQFQGREIEVGISYRKIRVLKKRFKLSTSL
ncbi:MAG: LytTR family transcriptional regulator DNA-binding domain-containing protein [Chitinophagaceae bacterium]